MFCLGPLKETQVAVEDVQYDFIEQSPSLVNLNAYNPLGPASKSWITKYSISFYIAPLWDIWSSGVLVKIRRTTLWKTVEARIASRKTGILTVLATVIRAMIKAGWIPVTAAS